MEVHISGCVNNPGKVVVNRFSKLRAAVVAANGFRHEKFLFPSGVITIRSRRKWKPKSNSRPIDHGFVRKRINIQKKLSELDAVRLREGDRIIVQAGGLGLSWWFGHSYERK